MRGDGNEGSEIKLHKTYSKHFESEVRNRPEHVWIVFESRGNHDLLVMTSLSVHMLWYSMRGILY